MVVMSQLYLCDEPYWSRFHVTGPPPQPSIHVISDGKIEAGQQLVIIDNLLRWHMSSVRGDVR